MRKIFLIMALLVISTAFLTSCAKDDAVAGEAIHIIDKTIGDLTLGELKRMLGITQYGFAKLNDGSTLSVDVLTFGEDSDETTNSEMIVWDGVENHFTIPADGVYELDLDATVSCSEATIFTMAILVDSFPLNIVDPTCPATTPVFRGLKWIGSLTKGQIISATINSATAANIMFRSGSSLSVKRIS